MPRPRLLLLEKSDVEDVHSAALELLSKVGVRVEDSLVEKLLVSGGCALSGSRVLIPEDLVEEALRKAPKRIALHDREGRHVATLGEEALVFNPGSAAIRVLDYGSPEPRTPTLEDVKKFAVLADALSGLQAQSTAVVPGDVPAEIRDAVRLYVVLKYSRKPVVTGAFTVENLPLMVEMLRAVREDYRERPFAIFDVCPTPPLSWSSITSRNVVDLARLGVPAEIISMPGLGGTAPVTIYGALTQHHAEVLSGIVIAQLAQPGAPVIYGGSPTVIHPYHGTALITAPESALLGLAYRDLAREIGLPCHTYMALSDSKAVDFQAGAETALTAALAAAAGFDVVSGPGMLEFESVQSMEKLVLDNEVCLMARRLSRGFRPDAEALDVVREVVLTKRGNFLAHKHTRSNYRAELHLSGVWDVASAARERRNLLDWAHAEAERILREHEPPVLEGDARAALDRVFAKLYERAGSPPPQI
ncbi:MAG: trimethylamine methyltransferase family protein [Thermofilum sp.]